jgi:4-amino-4-deoxy-L-arabinose transferase-like glycosyltransferase
LHIDLTGQTILITSAGRGIRLAIARGGPMPAPRIVRAGVEGAIGGGASVTPEPGHLTSDASDPATEPPGRAGEPAAPGRHGEPVAGSGLLATVTRLEWALLLFSVAVYAVTRLWALERYPVFFFTDEAVHPNLAARLLANGLRDHAGTFLPPYFQNDDRWNLSLSVYVHLVSVALLGKSIFVARATSAAVSLVGALATALALRVGFRSRVWWSAVLVLGALPVWFLHSRTAFETVLMASFYACFLCAYLLYRNRSPRFLYVALVCGAATFYSYANGPFVILATGVLLLLSDWRYHLRLPRRHQLGALVTVLVLSLPFLRFRWLHPEAVAHQMDVVDSYWLRDLPLAAKLGLFGQAYWTGISPARWFLPNHVDLDRHLMDGLGNMPVFLLPLFLLGLALCVWRWRSPAHRVVLAGLLAAPAAAVLATVYVTRGMAIVVPATLLVCLGLGLAFDWLVRRSGHRRAPAVLAVALAVLLGAWNVYLLRAALVDGPTWTADYGLNGVQYGAAQVFGGLASELAADPDLAANVSPDWTNNMNGVAEFFLAPEALSRLTTHNLDGVLLVKGDLDHRQLNVLTAAEYTRARASQKLVLDRPIRVIPYPDGRPGFYFLHMRYADDVDAQFAADRSALQRTVTGSVELDGQTVAAEHSVLDIGRLEDLFDGNPETLVRGATANPLVLEFRFPEPRVIERVKVHTSDMDLTLKVIATPADGGEDRTAESTYRDLPDEPRIDLPLPGGPLAVARLRVEILDLAPRIEEHIHVRDLTLR